MSGATWCIQICCGANVNNDTNFGDTVRCCSEVVAPERLKGFLDVSWAMTKPDEMGKGLRVIDLVGAEIARMRK